MIDEDVLRQALRDEANGYEPPAHGIEAILERADTPAVTARRSLWTRQWRERLARRRRVVIVSAVAVVAIAALATAALVGDSDGERAPQAKGTASDQSGVPEFEHASGGGPRLLDTGSAAGPAVAPDVAFSSGAADGGIGSSMDQAAGPAAVPAPPAFKVEAKVIKTGSIDLEVAEGGFGRSIDRITAVATGMGGFVAETSTQENDDSPSGTITVRVPGERFDDLLRDVRRLGDVKAATTQGRDVTDEFTDIEARLRALGATRDQLLTVLAEAETIGDILAVQDRINVVQVEIEQLLGRQRVLNDQTSLATLAVTLAEPGADRPTASERSGLAKAWDDARDGFVGGVERIVASSGPVSITLLFMAALVIILRAAWLLVRRRLV